MQPFRWLFLNKKPTGFSGKNGRHPAFLGLNSIFYLTMIGAFAYVKVILSLSAGELLGGAAKEMVDIKVGFFIQQEINIVQNLH